MTGFYFFTVFRKRPVGYFSGSWQTRSEVVSQSGATSDRASSVQGAAPMRPVRGRSRVRPPVRAEGARGQGAHEGSGGRGGREVQEAEEGVQHLLQALRRLKVLEEACPGWNAPQSRG